VHEARVRGTSYVMEVMTDGDIAIAVYLRRSTTTKRVEKVV
jgi:hypothetical protein